MTSRERGATLTQLLVTMGVVGTLVLIGAHQVNQWLPHYRLQAAARSLLVQIQRARLQAIQRGAAHYLDFDVDGDGCLRSGGCLLWEDLNGNLRKDPLERGETVLDFLALPGVWLKPYPQELGGPAADLTIPSSLLAAATGSPSRWTGSSSIQTGRAVRAPSTSITREDGRMLSGFAPTVSSNSGAMKVEIGRSGRSGNRILADSCTQVPLYLAPYLRPPWRALFRFR